MSNLDDDDEFRFNDASTHEGHLRHVLKRTVYYQQVHFQISISGHLFERIDVAHERIQCSRSGSVSP